MSLLNETPRTDSQKAKIRKHLEEGNTITPLQALHAFGSLRLAAVIFKLRDDGMEIHTILVENDDSRFAKYVLASFNEEDEDGKRPHGINTF